MKPLLVSVFLILSLWLATADAYVVMEAPAPRLALCMWDNRSPSEGTLHADNPMAQPCFNAKGTRMYVIEYGQVPHVASFAVTQSGGLTDCRHHYFGEHSALGVRPSPDGSQLLLMARAKDGGGELRLVDAKEKVGEPLVTGLDPERSQFAWSSDAKFVYYSAPAGQDKGLALKRVAADGSSSETIIEDGVIEFDVAREADRAVALASGTLFLIEGGEVANTVDPGGPVEGLRVSPDGSKAAWGGERLVVLSLEAGQVEATVPAPAKGVATDRLPAWSPDGKKVVFERDYRLGDTLGPSGAVISTGVRRTRSLRATSWRSARGGRQPLRASCPPSLRRRPAHGTRSTGRAAARYACLPWRPATAASSTRTRTAGT
jgi:hypothetical protein